MENGKCMNIWLFPIIIAAVETAYLFEKQHFSPQKSQIEQKEEINAINFVDSCYFAV